MLISVWVWLPIVLALAYLLSLPADQRRRELSDSGWRIVGGAMLLLTFALIVVIGFFLVGSAK